MSCSLTETSVSSSDQLWSHLHRLLETSRSEYSHRLDLQWVDRCTHFVCQFLWRVNHFRDYLSASSTLCCLCCWHLTEEHEWSISDFSWFPKLLYYFSCDGCLTFALTQLLSQPCSYHLWSSDGAWHSMAYFNSFFMLTWLVWFVKSRALHLRSRLRPSSESLLFLSSRRLSHRWCQAAWWCHHCGWVSWSTGLTGIPRWHLAHPRARW